MSDLIQRLISLADCDSRAGEPLGRCMREAATELDHVGALSRDLADCLEDMTKHYVEVRNDLFGVEAGEEVEVIAARKLIEAARS